MHHNSWRAKRRCLDCWSPVAPYLQYLETWERARALALREPPGTALNKYGFSPAARCTEISGH